jgi:hypothetical protein
MVDKTTGLFTDTVNPATATAGDHTTDTESSDGDGLVGGAQSSGSHSAWHSQVFAMWAGVAEPASSPTLLKFLQGKAVGMGVTGSVYAA